MPTEIRIVAFGPNGRSVRTVDGEIIQVPEGWELLPPGDAALTRRVKAGGPSWTVQEKKGRRTFSRGVWTPAHNAEPVIGDWQQWEIDAWRKAERLGRDSKNKGNR